MSDQHPLPVNSVRIPRFTDFYLGDHVANCSQINLSGRDSDSPFTLRNCNGEGRFGLVSVINRTEISLSSFSLNECRVVGMIFQAVVNIQIQPRYAHVLLSRRVKMPYISDSRDVAE